MVGSVRSQCPRDREYGRSVSSQRPNEASNRSKGIEGKGERRPNDRESSRRRPTKASGRSKESRERGGTNGASGKGGRIPCSQLLLPWDTKAYRIQKPQRQAVNATVRKLERARKRLESKERPKKAPSSLPWDTKARKIGRPSRKGQALGRSTRKEKELQGPEAKTTRKREIVTYGPNHARKRSCSGVGAARSSRSPSTQEGTIRGTIVNHARKRVRARKEHERGKGTPPPRRNVRKPSFASRGLNEGAWFSCATAWSFVGCVGKDRYNGFDRLVRNSRSCFPGRSVSLPGSGTKARSPVSRFMSSTVCAS